MRDLIAASGLIILPKSDPNRDWFFWPVWPWNLMDDLTIKTIGNLFHAPSNYVCHFHSHREFEFELPSGNAEITAKSEVFRTVWPWKLTENLEKTTGHLFNATSIFVHHFISIDTFKLGLPCRNAQFGSKLTKFSPVWPWIFKDGIETQ